MSDIMVSDQPTLDIPRMSQEEFIQLCQETLNTARTIEALLRGLNNGYDEALNALQNLKTELTSYINEFYGNTQDLEQKLEQAKVEIAKVLEQIEEIKPQMESIYKLAQSTEASLNKLEEINTNVTQIEQRIRELVDGINLEELEAFANRLKEELETCKDEKIEEIKNALLEETELALKTIYASSEQFQYLILEEKRKIEALLNYAKSEIERLKQEALDEIAQAGGVGWYRVLKECITTKNHALATLASKRVDKDKFDRIGSVINLAARKKEIPLGYVKPNTPLSIIDYAMLYHLSGSKSTDGKTFSIKLPSASATDYIYSGKEK